MTPDPTMLQKAVAAWDLAPPDWILELARLADASGLNASARRLGYSAAVISETIRNKYRGDLARVEATVRGALMGETVVCPVLGQIGRDACLAWQAKPRAVTNAVRTRVYRACRSGCPHSRLKRQDGETRNAE
ncbi:transcriptional regulator [Pannonibacter carbonis]|uniref:transcriptional regulator n=1 Tax=Pannonibacter carbonis TaxID=2067569 RepID=UPI000D0FCA64|nr:transcriptional regulator [Pannonibacter carbonis]